MLTRSDSGCGRALERTIEHAEKMAHDEWLAAGERKLAHAEGDGLVDPGLHVAATDALQPVVAGLRALEAEPAFEVAGGAGAESQLGQCVWLHVATRVAARRDAPVVAWWRGRGSGA